jgi:hypothetical protein
VKDGVGKAAVDPDPSSHTGTLQSSEPSPTAVALWLRLDALTLAFGDGAGRGMS